MQEKDGYAICEQDHTPSDHSWKPNSTGRPVSAPWKHPPLMPLLMQPANANMTVMLRARNSYQHHFVVSAPARGWGMAHLELGTLTQAVTEHFHHRNSSGAPVGMRKTKHHTSRWIFPWSSCPHSEDHTQPLIFTTWLQVIASTSTFASGSMVNHTNEMYSATSRVFILSLHFHHCEAPWKWLKGNTGTEAAVQLFH